jgi:hypothetical protein
LLPWHPAIYSGHERHTPHGYLAEQAGHLGAQLLMPSAPVRRASVREPEDAPPWTPRPSNGFERMPPREKQESCLSPKSAAS